MFNPSHRLHTVLTSTVHFRLCVAQCILVARYYVESQSLGEAEAGTIDEGLKLILFSLATLYLYLPLSGSLSGSLLLLPTIHTVVV